MKQKQQEMIATLVKESRMAKGYTQKELAELSNISIRSIQRIENGDIMPRIYTLKTLAAILEQPFEKFAGILRDAPTLNEKSEQSEEVTTRTARPAINKKQRIILSIGICLTIVFFAWAFVAQSPRFPETSFEMLVYAAVILLVMTGILFLLWRER